MPHYRLYDFDGKKSIQKMALNAKPGEKSEIPLQHVMK